MQRHESEKTFVHFATHVFKTRPEYLQSFFKSSRHTHMLAAQSDSV